MKPIDIAKVCHEVNRSYCQSIGDSSQLSWDQAPDWQKSSILMGVEMHLANPSALPSASHESWLAVKIQDGWKYGDVKDIEKKLHPCVCNYDKLPVAQQSKDYIFKAVVNTLAENISPDAQQEIDLVALGLTAPRVTADHIDAMMATLSYQSQVFGYTTIVVATLPTGFDVGIGKSACVSPENFNAAKGIEIAKKNAMVAARDKLWELEGYLLKNRLIGR